jgi:hypothetical protein
MRVALVLCVASISFAGITAAQDLQQASRPPVTKEQDPAPAAPKTHTMTGCLEKGDTVTSFHLIKIEGEGPKQVAIETAAPGVDLEAHLGHQITVTASTVTPSKRGLIEVAGRRVRPVQLHVRVHSIKGVRPTCP